MARRHGPAAPAIPGSDLLEAAAELAAKDPALAERFRTLARGLPQPGLPFDGPRAPEPPATIREAKEAVQRNLDRGLDCPVCGQFCKRYRRALNSTMARALIELVKAWDATQDWVRVQDCRPPGLDVAYATGEIGKLVHWGLVEPKPNEDPERRCSGLWRPTPAGLAFVKDGAYVPRAVYLFDNDCHGFDLAERITIEGALRHPFCYPELMRGGGHPAQAPEEV